MGWLVENSLSLFARTRFDITLDGDPRTSFRLLAQRRDGVVTPGNCWVYECLSGSLAQNQGFGDWIDQHVSLATLSF